MKYVFVVLLALLCVSVCEGSMSEQIKKYGVLDMTEESDFIAVGTVELMNAYYTEEVRSGGIILTDVLFKIQKLIKGKPNVGANHVKFAIAGGTAYVPKKDKVMSLTVNPYVEFEIGERVLLFLRIADTDGYHGNWPYGRLHVHTWTYGKKRIHDNKVQFLYEKDSKAKQTVIPLDLTRVLMQSYLKDKNATKPIENEIKALVRNSTAEHSVELSSKSASALEKKAKAILKKKKEVK